MLGFGTFSGSAMRMKLVLLACSGSCCVAALLAFGWAIWCIHKPQTECTQLWSGNMTWLEAVRFYHFYLGVAESDARHWSLHASKLAQSCWFLLSEGGYIFTAPVMFAYLTRWASFVRCGMRLTGGGRRRYRP